MSLYHSSTHPNAGLAAKSAFTPFETIMEEAGLIPKPDSESDSDSTTDWDSDDAGLTHDWSHLQCAPRAPVLHRRPRTTRRAVQAAKRRNADKADSAPDLVADTPTGGLGSRESSAELLVTPQAPKFIVREPRNEFEADAILFGASKKLFAALETTESDSLAGRKAAPLPSTHTDSESSSAPSTPIITPSPSYAVEVFRTIDSPKVSFGGFQLPHARLSDGHEGLLYDPSSRFRRRVYLTLPDPKAHLVTRPAPIPAVPVVTNAVPAPFPPLGTPKMTAPPRRSAMKGRAGSQGTAIKPRSVQWPRGPVTYTPPLDSYDLRELMAEPYEQEAMQDRCSYYSLRELIPELFEQEGMDDKYCDVRRALWTVAVVKHPAVGRTCA